MTPAVLRTSALAHATARDLLRRPGGALAWVAAAALVVLVPKLSDRAIEAGPELPTELVVSTLALYAAVIGGLAAVSTTVPGDPLGPNSELAATPIRSIEYTVGRVLGVGLALGLHVCGLAIAGLVAVRLGSPGEFPPASGLASAALGALGGGLFFVAAGALAGALLGRELGIVGILTVIVGTRLIVPHVTPDAPLLAALLPDPARLDLSREAAFAHPVGARALTGAFAGVVLQSIGLVALTAAVLAQRVRGAASW